MSLIGIDEREKRRLPDVPAGFVWGTATAAYQIEGAAAEDGRGPSIWDTFSRVPGAVADGSSGDVACDHYHRWTEDVDLLGELGADAYRFSVSWSRVLPNGAGKINQAGLDFYRRLVNGLAGRGIRPFVTLYHWDLPQALEDLGGWRNRDTAERFAEYAGVVADALGDRVQDWITLNEPYCSSITGYAEGRHAPGTREGHGALAAVHHLLLGHGLATRVLRERRPDARVGITLNLSPAVPATGGEADRAAAARQDLLVNRQFTDPVLAGEYPAGLVDLYAGVTDFGFREEGDLAVISAPLDFLGVNYYYRIHVADAPFATPDPARRSAYDIGVRTVKPEGVPVTDLGWPIEPEGLRATLTGLAGRFPTLPPIYVTENGRAELDPNPVAGPASAQDPDAEPASGPVPDAEPASGPVPDPERIDFVAGHLAAIREAMDAGVDVRGYFYWSLIDNFEWARGYGPRFGLVHIDYPTGTRTPKDSFRWLRDELAAR